MLSVPGTILEVILVPFWSFWQSGSPSGPQGAQGTKKEPKVLLAGGKKGGPGEHVFDPFSDPEARAVILASNFGCIFESLDLRADFGAIWDALSAHRPP